MDLDKLEIRVMDLESQVSDFKNQKDSATIQYKLSVIQQQLETLAVKVSGLENIITALNTDSKFAELFTKEEIKEYYKKSGLSMQDVQAFISKLCRNESTLEDAGNWINGNIDNIEAISRLGKYLKMKAITNAKKIV
jgi:phage shock protein A